MGSEMCIRDRYIGSNPEASSPISQVSPSTSANCVVAGGAVALVSLLTGKASCEVAKASNEHGVSAESLLKHFGTQV